jgi:HAD superfamily hydrolase (TIGR01509 family)
MIKAIIFDLDGVLVDIKEIHYKALNESLGDEYKITWDEHISTYDGLKTKDKLKLISEKKNLPIQSHNDIWKKKQIQTEIYLSNLKKNENLIETLSFLKKNNFKLSVCSNSIKKTINLVLEKLEILNFFDLILSNEDVSQSKPNPEIYWSAMIHFGVLPEETLIIEDSPNGIKAALSSGANTLRVKNSEDVNSKKIIDFIECLPLKIEPSWVDYDLNVLIPMAGEGSRFREKGYDLPKPLIDVKGKPMIHKVIENLNLDCNYIFIIQQEHVEKNNIDLVLNAIKPKSKIIKLDSKTEGAAVTALKSKDYVNNDNPLLISNCDQYVEWSSLDFMYKMQESNCDGGIVTFKSTNPKWSFAKVDENNFILEVAEKNVISDNATVGFYYWKKGSDFVKYAESMINKNIRVNNEFYICPVYNEAIKDGKKIVNYSIKKMWGIGTPEDLNLFLKK